MQRAHEFCIEFGNRTGDEAEGPGFPEAGCNLQRVGYEIEVNFKHALGVGNRRGGQTTSAHVESRSPKMVDGRAQRQTDFAHDLGPHVQSGIRVLPFGERKCGPRVRLFHTSSSCSGTNRALVFDFPETFRKSSAPRQVAFIEDSNRMRVYITPRTLDTCAQDMKSVLICGCLGTSLGFFSFLAWFCRGSGARA